jgi:dethiobiotin synthetase
MKEIIFVSGIGTNVGKSYATGWLANKLNSEKKNAITLKMIQTGNDGYSEDIDIHRKIMGLPLLDEDKDFTTAPIIMTYPASPHLAAKIDHCTIDLSKIDRSTEKLFEKYDTILMEGAGGLMVPITETYTTIDYIREHNLPLALVTNGQLGSISHTLLALEAIKTRQIKLKYVVYNPYFDEDKIIAEETQKYLGEFLKKNFPETEYLIMNK